MLQNVTECYRVFLEHLLGPLGMFSWGRLLAFTVISRIRLDNIATSLFEDNWLSGQIVSDGRIYITLLILSRGALSNIFLIPSDAKLASKPSVARAP